MGLSDTETIYGSLSVYIPFIIIILCFYIWWIAAYEYNDEFTLGFLLVILGIMYACASYLVAIKHGWYGSCLAFSTIVIVITIATVSGLKQKDGTQGSNFLCLGVIPLISGICFSFIALCMGYTIGNVGIISGQTVNDI